MADPMPPVPPVTNATRAVMTPSVVVFGVAVCGRLYTRHRSCLAKHEQVRRIESLDGELQQFLDFACNPVGADAEEFQRRTQRGNGIETIDGARAILLGQLA